MGGWDIRVLELGTRSNDTSAIFVVLKDKESKRDGDRS